MVLRLLHYSDLEKVYDHPDRVGRVAGLIETRRDEETLVVGTGDNVGPGVLALVTRGEQALDLFEAVEPDAGTLGNHDFDHGPTAAREMIEATPQRWVCANVFEDDDRAVRFAADEGVVPWTVLTAGPHRVGVVGVAHPETPAMNPKVTELAFTDPFEAAREGVAAVRERGVDRVVILSHLGDADEKLAEVVDVDAILGGHVREERIDRCADTLLTRPGADGHHLVEITLGKQAEATLHDVAEAPVHEGVRDAIRERIARTGLDEVVATVEEPIPCGTPETKGGESLVGNLFTDALRWATGADVAAVASGTIRASPPLTGTVTAMDLVGLDPWDDRLVVVSITGEQLLETFREFALAYRYEEVPDWYVGHVSGATLTWDGPGGDLVAARVGGERVRESETYTLATSDYLVESAHLFSAFDETDCVEWLGEVHEYLVDYARAVGIDPRIERRIDLAES